MNDFFFSLRQLVVSIIIVKKVCQERRLRLNFAVFDVFDVPDGSLELLIASDWFYEVL